MVNSTFDHLYGWATAQSSLSWLLTVMRDRIDSKSRAGVLVCLVGPRAHHWSKKKTSVSKSTPKAEIVALDHGVSKEGMA